MLHPRIGEIFNQHPLTEDFVVGVALGTTADELTLPSGTVQPNDVPADREALTQPYPHPNAAKGRSTPLERPFALLKVGGQPFLPYKFIKFVPPAGLEPATH